MSYRELLTVGMATYREPQIWSTLEGLHANHPRVSYVVVDNAPEPDLKAMNTCYAIGGTYYHRPDLHGTAAPRDAVFRLAKTPWVMCIDAHVLLESGALRALLDYISSHGDSKDLLTGPYVYDNGTNVHTHWRAEESAKPGLWGVWDSAWMTPKGRVFCIWGADLAAGRPLKTFRDLEGNEISPPTGVNIDDPRSSGCTQGGRDEELLAYWRGETPAYIFKDKKQVHRTWGQEYEIPMNGLGLFCMRRAVWPGFHPLFRGFGAEEGFLHEHVRRNGGKCLNLPHLGWRHCFRNLGGTKERPIAQETVPYSLNLSDHVWNLLVGHRELGVALDAQMHDHFGKRLPGGEQEWTTLKQAAFAAQPFGTVKRPKRKRVLGVWYTNNAADQKTMEGSLRTIQRAVNETMRHDVKVTTASWVPVPNNPFPCVVGKPGDAPAGHASILASIRRCINKASEDGWTDWDGICFLEHDVLYPPGYFDRMGDALASGAGVISHLDYEGVNKTGWCRTTNRHEPMHQMGMRRDVALANLTRAEDECRRNGGCLIEPDSVLPCNRQTSSGLLGVDFDGTLTAGHVPLFQDFAVISGRHISEQAEVRKVVGPNRAIFLRTNDTPPTDHGIAVHKAKIILEMNVVEFWEDNEVQARLIQEACPKVVVHHVSGPPRMPDRSHWHRIGPSAHDKRPFGLTPSIHVNGPWAFTGHGAVCYEDKSSLGTTHPFWGQASQWLEGASMGCPGGCGGGGQQGQQGGAPTIPTPAFSSIDEWVAHASKSGSDFNEHVEFLRDLAKGLDTIVEMCLWQKPSLPALLAAKPKKLISLHPLGKGQQWDDAKRFLPDGTELVTGPDTPPEACDLFFHDKNHEASAVTADLEKWGPLCRRYIVIHCTEIYGEKGDLGGPGVRHAVRDWVRRHPEWTVVHNRKNNYGLMVLSRDDRDKHKIPGKIRLGLSYLANKARHKMQGGTYLSLPVVKERFDECAVCDQHTGGRCADCGCWLLLVSEDSPVGAGQPGRLWHPELGCPLGKWSDRPKDGIVMSAEQIQEQVERWDE